MTKQELIDALSPFDPDDVVIVRYEKGQSYSDIEYIYKEMSAVVLLFGDSRPCSDSA